MSSYMTTRDTTLGLAKKIVGKIPGQGQAAPEQAPQTLNTAAMNPGTQPDAGPENLPALPDPHTANARLQAPGGTSQQPMPAPGGDTAQQSAGGAIAIGSAGASIAPRAPGLAAGIANTPGANQPPPPSPVDQLGSQFADPTKYFEDAQAAIGGQEKRAQQTGADQIAALQRRAATLSALSGRGLGGGFASAMTGATVQGVNQLQGEMNKIEAQRQAIFGNEAGQAFTNQQNDKQRAADLAKETAQNNAQEGALDLSGEKSAALSGPSSTLKHYDMDPSGATRAAGSTVNRLVTAVNNAKTAADLAAARQALDAFVAKLGQLKAQNAGADKGKWQDVVNQAEQAGYFN